MKYVMVIGSGMSGVPIPRLNQHTSLEKTEKVALDTIAREGVAGLVSSADAPFEGRRDAALMSLLGFSAKNNFPGLAGLLAARHGLTPAQDEHFLACDLVVLESGRLLGRLGRLLPEIESKQLVSELNDDLELPYARLEYCEGGLQLLVFSKPGELNVRTCPPILAPDVSIERYLPRGGDAEALLVFMERARAVLKACDTNRVRVDLGNQPVNAAWPWEESRKIIAEKSFADKFGVSSCMICDTALAAGTANFLGMNCILEPSCGTLGPEGFERMRDAALRAITEFDFVCMHTNAPERAALQFSPGGKSKVISELDRILVAPFLNQLDFADSRIMVVSDGTVSALNGRDYPGATPFAMYGAGINSNSAKSFGETDAADTRLRFLNGSEMFERFIRV